MSPTDSFPQHGVTAVIVAHDGAGWLAHGLEALGNQTKPVQRVVAVDTGSRDRSGSVLAARLGQGAVFGMDRSAGYAAAVRRAVQHKAASASLAAGQPGRGRPGDQVEWLWLLHDDCEPAPDALEQLLRGAADTQSAAVLGPKLMDWIDRDVIVEAGLTVDSVGRRITGVEPGEVDQGQHDGDRDTLAVSSAGMLVRRDVWEQVGGFDPGMTLFGEDIDFCWRVHAAGYRVRVITDSVVYHARAATKGRRAISVGRRARLLDRRNGLVTLLGNLPFGQMLISLAGNLTLSFLRTLFYLVAKRPAAALDESAAVLGVVGHPVRLAKLRHRRASGRRQAYGRLRGDLPRGRSIRRAAEFFAGMLTRSSRQDVAGARHASDDPTDDESLLIDTGFLQRILTRPGVLIVLALIAVAIAAQRSVVTAGTLGGGALLPAWEGASGLWSQFLSAFHPTGIGSASTGLPYVGILAVLATVLGGKPWLAIDVLLLGSVPMAGIAAILALRKVTKSVPVRVWAAVSYALLPVAFGAIAAGRLGSAVAFVVIPLIGLLAGRMFSEQPKLARRAAWATGLAVTVGAAFVPLLWLLALAGAVLAALRLYRAGRGMLANLAIAALTPPVLLMPWMLPLLKHPSLLLLEAGVQRPGLAVSRLPAKSLLLLSPGGPGLPPYWVSGALVLAGLAALLATKRRQLVIAGWIVALLGLAAGLAVSRVTVTPPGGQPMTPWPGVPLEVAAAGLLLAAATAASDLGGRVAGGGRRGRRRLVGLRAIPVAVLTLAACSAPLLAAGYWLLHGVDGPLAPATGEIVPPFVSAIAGANRQVRTLVLTMSGGRISYLLLRGGSPQLGDTGLTAEPAAQSALNAAVAGLVAPGGGGAADQSQLLARFDIGFVLMRAPVNGQLASVLDSVAGLTPVSMRPNFDLWRLTDLPSRVSVVEPNGTVAAVPSGPVGVSAAVPTAGGTLELSEPAGGWSATLNGHALTAVASPAGSWAQAFKLPPGGGTLTVGRSGLLHDVLSWLEILAFLVAAALALPGVRTAAEMEAAAASALAAELDEQSAEGTDAEGEAAPLAAAAASGRAVRGRTAVRGTAGGAGRHGAGDLGELASGDRPGRDAARRGAALSRDVAEVREVAGVTTRAETFAGTETFAGAETFAGTETFAGAETVAGPEAVDNGARGMAAPRGHTGAHRGADARGDAGARSGPGVRGGARAREEGEEAEPAKGRGRRLNRRGQGRGGQDATRRGDPERDDARRGEGQRGERERAGEQRDLPLQTGERGNDGIAGKTRKLGRKDKGRSGRPDLPSRDGVAAGGAAAVAGPAAGVSPAAAAGSATARAAAASALRPDIDPGSSGSPPGRRAAWPAGQPPSRFLAGPPDARMPPAGYGPSGPGAQPNREDDSLGYDPRAARAATAPRSPSGSPYDEPPSRDPSSAVSSGYGAPSPSGARYQDDAAAAYRPAGYRPDDGYGRGYGDDTGYRDGSAGHTPVRGYAPDPGYGGDRGDGYDRAGAANRADPNHPGGSGYGDDSTHEPGGHLAGPVPRSQPPAAADWQDSGWHDTATSGSRTGHGSGWPEPDKRQGWSQDYQQPSWPQDHPAAGPASGHGSAWPVPEQQPWVDSGEELGALPSAGEVHHDWPGRDDRTGWPTPGREAEGEEW